MFWSPEEEKETWLAGRDRMEGVLKPRKPQGRVRFKEELAICSSKGDSPVEPKFPKWRRRET